MSGAETPTQLAPMDLIEAAKWNSALFTTFPFSLSFFEAAPLIKLRAGNCRQITVLADVLGYSASMSERGASGAGRSFELRPVLVRSGCFHPKVTLLLGANGPRAVIGSGNLTFTGWGGNLELADYLSPSLSGAALRDLGEFLEQLPTSPKIDGEFGDLTPFVEACNRVGDTGRARLVHDLERPIIERLIEAVEDEGGAQALKVVSPYYGSGDGVIELAARLRVYNVSIFSSGKTRDLFPVARAKAAGLEVKPVKAAVLDASARPLHGKAIEIETKSGKRLVLTGSVNVTSTALIEGKNVELAVLRILAGASHFGWSASTMEAPTIVAESESGESPPVVTASLEAGALIGRVLWRKPVDGDWRGAVKQGVRRIELTTSVSVDAAGRFRVTDAGLAALTLGGSALQVELVRGDVVARGWILFADFLAAVRERGAVAESMFRVVADTADVNDLETILEFVAREPNAFSRISTSKPAADAEGAAPEPANKYVSPNALGPVTDRISFRDRQGGGSAFDRLLAALRAKVLKATTTKDHAERRDDASDDGEEVDKPTPNRTVRAHYFERFFETFEKRIAEAADEPDRRHDLQTLLGFIRFCAERMEDGELQRSDLQARWLRCAARYTVGFRDELDEIDLELALAICARVLLDPKKVAEAHGELQRHWRGPIPPPIADGLLSKARQGKGRHWSPFARDQDWRTAIETTLAVPTQWQNALWLMEAVRANGVSEAPIGFQAHQDISGLRGVLSAGKAERIVALEAWSGGICPSCHVKMPSDASDRLRRTRLARCQKPRCGRYIVFVGV
jgi:hypothetical protein